MPGAVRLGDNAHCPADGHGCPGCVHGVVGPAVSGSPNVSINSRPAVRVGDRGIHAACCGPNTWIASQGSPNVFINGRPAVRLGDQTTHCGGVGQTIEGSTNVFINQGSAKTAQVPVPPSGSTAVVQDALKARDAAIRLLDERIRQLEQDWNDPATRKQFADRFGTDDDGVKDDVLAKLRNIRAAVAGLGAQNFKAVPKSQSQPGRFAYVDPNDSGHSIHLDSEFANAPMTGRDSKVGTIVHEVSHFNDVAAAKDIVYGREADLLLAPEDAAYNADTVERYVEDASLSVQGVR